MKEKKILYVPKHLKKLSVMIEEKIAQKTETKKGLFQTIKRVFK